MNKLTLFLICAVSIFGYLSSTLRIDYSPDNLILDISQIIKAENLNDPFFKKTTIQLIQSANSKNQTFLFYFEADTENDLHKGIIQVGKLFKDIDAASPALQVKLLLSLGFLEWNKINKIALTQLLKNCISILAGLSLKDLNTEKDCSKYPGQQNKNLENIKNYKSLLSKQNLSQLENIMKTGYVIDYQHINCPIHIKNTQDANYIIINIPFNLDDIAYIHSFGMFQENMDNIADSVKQFISDDKQIFFRISLSEIWDLSFWQICKMDGYEDIWSNCNSYEQKDEILKQVNSVNSMALKKFQNILARHVAEWARKNDENIILGSDYVYFKDSDWTNRNDGIIPYFLNLPAGMSSNLDTSASTLLLDAVQGGFEKVMIKQSEFSIQKKGTSNKHQAINCTKLSSKRHSNQEKQSSDAHGNQTDEQKDLCAKFDQITFNFLFNFRENYFLRWIDTYKKFEPELVPVKTQNFLKSFCNATAKRYDFTRSSSNGICFGLQIPQLLECNKPDKSARSAIVREVTIPPIIDDVNDKDQFYEDLLKTLNALKFARQIAKIDYPIRPIYLHVKRECDYESQLKLNEQVPSIYCNRLREIISQFYDVILTWSKIHDFPVVVEIHNHKILDFGNPLAWDRLSITNIGLKEVMNRSPIFVRRRYNQSMVFGRWVDGAYPCIHKTVNTSDLENLIFDQFSGATLNLKMRSSQRILDKEEIEMLLLLTLQKFLNIEIILDDEQNQLDMLVDVMCSKHFASNLNLNKIKGNILFLQVAFPSMEIRNRLNETGDHLGLYIYFVDSFNEAVIPGNSSNIDHQLSILHPNCISLANNIVITKNSSDILKLNKASFLICETVSISATNKNENEMQDYLDSHLYFSKLFRPHFPNIKDIYFRLKPVYNGATLNEKTVNLLMFLRDVQKFASVYNIHYFLMPAFASESLKEPDPSFWEIKDYNDLTVKSVFQDIIQKHINKDTWTPNLIKQMRSKTTKTPKLETATTSVGNGSKINQNEAKSSQIFGFSGYVFNSTLAVLFCGVLLTIILIIIFKKRNKYLTAKEVKEFKKGRMDTLVKASRISESGKRYHGNIFDGLVHQKQFEIEKYRLNLSTKELIAEGRYSSVFQVKLKRRQHNVALKIASKNCPKETFKGMLSEVKFLCYVGNHSNIVNLLGCYSKEIDKGVLWMVTEFCEGGSLLNYLKSLKSDNADDEWSGQDLVRFACEIAAGMKHIGNQNAIHGDLCANHVLLGGNLTCKISGFGLSRKLKMYKVCVRNEQQNKMPWQWMSPEVLRNLEFSKQSDVWSYGVTLWEIFSLGNTPYPDVTWTSGFIDDLENGMRMSVPVYATNDILNVIQKCWNGVAERRETFAKLVEYFIDLMPQKSMED